MNSVLSDETDINNIYDVSKKENRQLQSVVDAEMVGASNDGTAVTNQAAVQAELERERLLKAESERMQSRVLFVTNQSSYLDPRRVKEDFADLTEVFEEVHILLLTDKQYQKHDTFRIGKQKCWLYHANSRFLSLRVFAALKLVARQLQFTDGFRPDLVVALDPYESAQVARDIAKKYDRPWQIHALDARLHDPNATVKLDRHDKWRLRLAKSILPKAPSVRFANERVEQLLRAAFSKLPADTAVLPQFYNLEQLTKRTATPQPDLFKQFQFTLLYIGRLDNDSDFHVALDAARHLLKTPTIGLAVIGTGPRKEHYVERAKLLGIEQQLVFLGRRDDYVDELASANLLIVPETTRESDERVITGAALGTPLVITRNELREAIFTNEESALLVEPGNVAGMAAALKKFLNTGALRQQLAESGKRAVTERIEEDPQMYRILYRNSIETVLVSRQEQRQRAQVAQQVSDASRQMTAASEQYREVDGVAMKLPEQRT